ncbi:hypothetical protein Pmani_037325 [Petrolisthes manimaculis]|uniref:Uncharacterized protein n=1 Tax=Petrolisthes manimaculis TaxID=1843537 RepID=A0AAE1NIL7_9EUCA|nr:hypothetical protein Pmani_037325 [Petrolisthes manimaculis]
MSSGSTELPQHLQELENYMPREELLTLFPNVTKEQVDLFLNMLRNESIAGAGAGERVNTAPPLPADHAFCDVGFRDGYKRYIHTYILTSSHSSVLLPPHHPTIILYLLSVLTHQVKVVQRRMGSG